MWEEEARPVYDASTVRHVPPEQQETCKTLPITCKTAPSSAYFLNHNILKNLNNFGAGEGNRTLDTQLGKKIINRTKSLRYKDKWTVLFYILSRFVLRNSPSVAAICKTDVNGSTTSEKALPTRPCWPFSHLLWLCGASRARRSPRHWPSAVAARLREPPVAPNARHSRRTHPSTGMRPRRRTPLKVTSRRTDGWSETTIDSEPGSCRAIF